MGEKCLLPSQLISKEHGPRQVDLTVEKRCQRVGAPGAGDRMDTGMGVLVPVCQPARIRVHQGSQEGPVAKSEWRQVM